MEDQTGQAAAGLGGNPRRRGARLAIVLMAAALVTGPALADPAEPPGSIPFSEIPGWEEGTTTAVLPPLLASCARWAAMPAGYSLGGDGNIQALGGTPVQWRAACAALQRVSRTLPPLPRSSRRSPSTRSAAPRAQAEAQARRNLALRDALETLFIAQPAGTGLLTGYFEPILRGALTPGEPYTVPLYARPPELVEASTGRGRRSWGVMQEGRLEPMPDRAAITAGAMAGRGLELAWVTDPLDAFILQIQGSGRVQLPNGAVLRLGYAGQNGLPFRSVEQIMTRRGVMGPNGPRTLRELIAAAGPEVLHENPSYVFLRRVEGLRNDQGPIGALGVPLTSERSLAVDPAQVPLGAPVFLTPAAGAPARAAPRLVVAQDTGGVIRGPGRGDLFTGWGPEAEARAMGINHPVTMFVLVPRPAEPEDMMVAGQTDRRASTQKLAQGMIARPPARPLEEVAASRPQRLPSGRVMVTIEPPQ
ncbi:murein transglycosylase A [Roseomonas chloroacetimidivorans]|uniref:murein transglycosylase A n=1 Tax=Roseomonas chloroacetimidivorans TaxID=1766656 RepID=UPI003C7680F9